MRLDAMGAQAAHDVCEAHRVVLVVAAGGRIEDEPGVLERAVAGGLLPEVLLARLGQAALEIGDAGFQRLELGLVPLEARGGLLDLAEQRLVLALLASKGLEERAATVCDLP